MGVTSRLLHMLLSAPSPLLPLRPSAAVLRRPLPPLSAAAHRHSHLLLSLPLPLRTDGRSPFHTRSATRDGHGGPGVSLRQWPQWSAFVDRIVSGGYGEGPSRAPLGGDEDAMEESLEVPADFASAVRACLAFARDRPGLLRSLPKKDIEVVASNVTPFLFKKRWETVQRMEAYLNSNQGSNEEVRTVDLVQYLICYAHDHIFCSQGKVYNTTELDASVCNLLQEIVNLSGLVQESYFTNSTDRRSPSSLAQSSGSTGLAMKGGDWICPKCDFMNFARNMKCLECDEARPRKPLVSGEWECPQCDFFNFGRNITCLRCDCSRPSNSHLQPTTASRGYRDTSNGEEQVLGRNSAINRSLDKILCKTSNISSTGNRSRQITVGTRDEITPEKRAPNVVPFVPLPADAFRTPNDSSRDGPSVSASLHAPTEKPSGIMFSESSESAAGSPSYQESSDSRHRTSELHNSGKSAGQNSYDDFPEIMPMRKGENRFVVSKKKDRSLTSPLYKRQSSMEQANGPNFVPFVPFPPDYFANKNKQPEDSCVDSKNDMSTDDASSESSQSSVGRLNKTSSPEWMSSSENPQVNHQGGNVVSSGRSWFQDKVDPSALRGGANTSISSENPQVNHQGGNVVSSGRGWFQDKVDPSAFRGGANTSISSYNNNNQNAEAESWRTRFSEGPKSRNIGGPWNPVGDMNNGNWTGDGSANSSGYTKGRNYSRTDPSRSSSPIAPSSQTNNADGQTNAYPSLGRSNPHPSNAESMVPRLAENKGPREGSSWKSLEGSAVTEPDPLDMSEEAKAQRWFRRVAQITDISELANIPDEDFPQIMPMRKGVNRFVVSKRKTPLERRLTSAQYRRNLPVVSSEPQIDASNQGEN